MTGKQKCAILKQIRRDIAAKNDINITIAECTHKGKCKGTCPRCEAEVRMLERELEKKRKAGARTVLAGVSAGLLAASLASCTPVEKVKDLLHLRPSIDELEGDVPYTAIPGEPIEQPLPDEQSLPDEQLEVFVTEGEPAIDPQEYEQPLMGEPAVDPEECEGDDCEPDIAGLIAEPEQEEEP